MDKIETVLLRNNAFLCVWKRKDYYIIAIRNIVESKDQFSRFTRHMSMSFTVVCIIVYINWRVPKS